MKSLVFCALICSLGVASGQAVKINYTSDTDKSVIYTFKKPVDLVCSAEGGTEGVSIIKWTKDNNASVETIPNFESRFELSFIGLTSTLRIKSAEASDGGKYYCIVSENGDEKARGEVTLASDVYVRIKQENINVVEENKLMIECDVVASPHLPIITWRVETERFNGSVVKNDSSIYRIKDHEDQNQNVTDGMLVIDKVGKEDRGSYYCVATNKYYANNTEEYKTMVRVKDKYAAVWPFLAICAEVIILCAIIIIYEKKRNKTELEESDTDQSPDQKNTPDNGKESNLRHRQ